MPQKDFYLVLGVSRGETLGGIRSAYRDLARRFHPDRVGEQGTRAFQQINEAYDVLSDVGIRREHDRALNREREIPSTMYERSRPRGAVEPAEPMIPDKYTILGKGATVRPSFEALRDRFVRNFTGIGVPKSEAPEALNLTLALTPDEATTGAILEVVVPVYRRCPECGGTGGDWFYPCSCRYQQGLVEDNAIVRVRIPAMVCNGATIEVPLREQGIYNLYLRLHLFIT